MHEQLTDEIKCRARELGFDLCGIAPAGPSEFKTEYRAWMAKGFHGEMAYMARDPERRLDPALVLPGARSIVVAGMNYYTVSEADTDAPDRALFARYARNRDYHDVMAGRLRDLLAFIRERAPETEGRVYVDTGPLLEREAAWRAGLGWFGKNTMLINTRRGSYFLLGEILLNLPLPPDQPAHGGCGTCTRCLDACPTGAIVRPYELDARQCISYLTIEQKGPIPGEPAAKMNRWVFGCDICQEVCPFNIRRAEPTDEPSFQPREITRAPLLTDLLSMTDDEFRQAFRRSPVKRAKRRGLLRNAAAALSSSDEPETERALKAACEDPDPLVREQAMQSLSALRVRRARGQDATHSP
jgi:epoxyqueuosine reductase